MKTGNLENTTLARQKTHPNRNKLATTLLAMCVALGGGLSANTALAGDHGHHSRIKSAKVTKVEPITRTIQRRTPYEECWTEQVRYEHSNWNDDSYTGTILGGVIGGAIGNAVGHKKKNKQVGTAVGALLGASIGRDISRSHRSNHHDYSYRDEQRCETHYETTYEEKVIGYNVWYRYNGESFKTRMDRDPGDRIKVRVSVSPL